MKAKCPHCGLVNFPDAVKCRRCKKDLPLLCPECFSVRALEAQFCSSCGCIFDKEQVDASAYKSKSSSQRSYRSKKEFQPHRYGIMKCTGCQETISTESLFCPHCGQVMTTMEYASRKVRVAMEEAEVYELKDMPLQLEEVDQFGQTGSNLEPVLLEDVVGSEASIDIKSIPLARQPEPEPLPLIQSESTEIPDGMVFVPEGPFLSGNEKRQKAIDEFFIDVLPVTNAQYLKFVRQTGADVPDDWFEGRPMIGKKDHPIVNVSYNQAAAYAKWVGKRLPTTDEWEKAARGDKGLIYPWGDEFLPEAVNSRESQLNTTISVGFHKDNISMYGVKDMVGNVSEWVAKENDHVHFRGGSFLDDMNGVRTTSKFVTASANFKSFFIGFRCAKDVW